MNKTILTAAVVALVVAIGVAVLYPVKVEKAVVDFGQVLELLEGLAKKFGAVSGPDRFPPDGCETVNGVKTCSYQVSGVSSTTPCNIEVPFYNQASSSLISAGILFRSTPTTTSEVRIFTSLSRNASTTLLSGASLATTATGTAVVATTTLTGDDAVMAAGDRYITFSIFNGLNTYVAVSQAPVCTAVFQVYQ